MDHHVEIVRDRLDPEQAAAIRQFWASHGALSGSAADARLPDVVAVLLDGDDTVVGTNSVYEASVPLIGGRRFQIYRRFLAPGVPDEAEMAMIGAVYAALDAKHDPDAGGPVGLCVLVDDPAFLRRHPDAVWPDTAMVYAGYTGDGRQVRIRYFTSARIIDEPPGRPDTVVPTLDSTFGDGYQVHAFGEADVVTGDDVLALWDRHGVVTAEEAARRLHEVILVATDPAGELAGVCTAYLARNGQLRMDMWHVRVFVPEDHRLHRVAAQLAWHTRTRLEQRYVTGEDKRGAGQIGETENEALRRYVPQGLVPYWELAFIGETSSGAHVRVCYFPGATAPLPTGG